MTAITLGQRLRNRQLAEEQDGLLKLQREAKNGGPAAQRKLFLVQDFFFRAQTVFTSAIEEGRDVPSLQLGNGVDGAAFTAMAAYDWKKTTTIAHESNRYFPVWKRFLAWCSEHELEPKLTDDYNDRETWWLLTVGPALD